jgi:1-acyl-sn-glycerol-3-phosphate acyltransferase
LRTNQLHKSDGLLFNLIEPAVGLALYAMFRRIELHGKEKIPLDKPLLIVANHPTAFMDPLLLCALLDQPLYNMTRGDIFMKPIMSKLLYSCNMFPIYRAKDGFNVPRKNDRVFDYVIKQLKEKKTIVVFAEGLHHLDHQVRPLQKGVVHIAQYAYDNVPELRDLQIIPIGINYHHGDRPWDSVSIVVGDPIHPAHFYQGNDNIQTDTQMRSVEANQSLLNLIETQLKQVAHHLNDTTDYPVFNLAKDLIRSEIQMPFLPQVKQGTNTTFTYENALVQRLNMLPTDLKADLKAKASIYSKALVKARTDERTMSPHKVSSTILNIRLILGFIPFVLGYLGSLPVRALPLLLSKKPNVKVEFITSILIGVGILIGMAWYPFWAIVSLFSGHPYLIALGLSLPLLGWFSNLYRSWLRDKQYQLAARKLEKDNKILSTRKELVEALVSLNASVEQKMPITH